MPFSLHVYYEEKINRVDRSRQCDAVCTVNVDVTCCLVWIYFKFIFILLFIHFFFINNTKKKMSIKIKYLPLRMWSVTVAVASWSTVHVYCPEWCFWAFEIFRFDTIIPGLELVLQQIGFKCFGIGKRKYVLLQNAFYIVIFNNLNNEEVNWILYHFLIAYYMWLANKKCIMRRTKWKVYTQKKN